MRNPWATSHLVWWWALPFLLNFAATPSAPDHGLKFFPPRVASLSHNTGRVPHHRHVYFGRRQTISLGFHHIERSYRHTKKLVSNILEDYFSLFLFLASLSSSPTAKMKAACDSCGKVLSDVMKIYTDHAAARFSPPIFLSFSTFLSSLFYLLLQLEE